MRRSSLKEKVAGLIHHEKTIGLTAEETAEFDYYLQLENLVHLAKAHAITIQKMTTTYISVILRQLLIIRTSGGDTYYLLIQTSRLPNKPLQFINKIPHNQELCE